jgi:hypothetical protein
MTTKKKTFKNAAFSSTFDQARDELFSHILRCGVIEADEGHQKEWMDDTMQYIGERYPELDEEHLGEVRVLGERFCKPVVPHGQEVATSGAE